MPQDSASHRRRSPSPLVRGEWEESRCVSEFGRRELKVLLSDCLGQLCVRSSAEWERADVEGPEQGLEYELRGATAVFGKAGGNILPQFV